MPERDRADAARNSESILRAAEVVLAVSDADGISMIDVANRAGVGKGTVYRAFGDKSGLLRALMVSRSAPLRAAIAADGGPLSAAAPPRARVIAIIEALARFKLDNRSLSLALDQLGAGSPYEASTYGWWHGVLASLVRDVTTAVDADYLAHLLLAGVRSDLMEHLVSAGRDPDDVVSTVVETATTIVRQVGQESPNSL